MTVASSTEHVGGWWRVTAPAKLEELDKALHERGIRERDLRAKLRSYKDVVTDSCSMVRTQTPADLVCGCVARFGVELTGCGYRNIKNSFTGFFLLLYKLLVRDAYT